MVIEKIPGGFSIDGLILKNGKCGCTSVAKCCYSWSKVKKRDDNLFEFVAKMTTADSKDNYVWSYRVMKEGIIVKVRVEDARDKDVSSAYIPPSVKDWEKRGWSIVEKEYDRQDGIVWRCATCKWLYKDESEGQPFEELPVDWRCPVCKAPKTAFEKIG